MELQRNLSRTVRGTCLGVALAAAAAAGYWQLPGATPLSAPGVAAGALTAQSASSAHEARSVPRQETTVYIVQGADLDTARAAVETAGGVVTRELGIIDAVGAELTAQALQRLQLRGDVRALANTTMRTSARTGSSSYGTKSPAPTTTTTTPTPISTTSTATAPSFDTSLMATITGAVMSFFPDNVGYPALVGADQERAAGVTGNGVTVAVLDTGLTPVNGLQFDGHLQPRVLAGFDAIQNKVVTTPADGNGHGTHLTGIIMNSDMALDGTQTGVAPNARLVDVKAFGDDGSATYLDVITGMDWILKNKSAYSIRVLNLSFSATPSSHYWDDPVNQAVMKLWQAGIVVVASAGNDGPTPMTIGVPGNTPYIITVGAMTDNYTTTATDDKLASFSSVGPTYEGFIKPEVVAPGGHIVSLMSQYSARIAAEHPEFQVNGNYFRMSGTSQSTAVVTGVVALMLEEKPWLTPDDVKCQLMSSAKQAVDATGALAYSVFQQGAGVVNAQRAVASTNLACANRGLDLAADLAGKAHFGGLAQQDSAGNFYVIGVDGSLWSRGNLYSDGYLWSRSTLDSASLWSAGFLWSNGYLWSRSVTLMGTTSVASLSGRSAGVNHWVNQE